MRPHVGIVAEARQCLRAIDVRKVVTWCWMSSGLYVGPPEYPRFHCSMKSRLLAGVNSPERGVRGAPTAPNSESGINGPYSFGLQSRSARRIFNGERQLSGSLRRRRSRRDCVTRLAIWRVGSKMRSAVLMPVSAGIPRGIVGGADSRGEITVGPSAPTSGQSPISMTAL